MMSAPMSQLRKGVPSNYHFHAKLEHFFLIIEQTRLATHPAVLVERIWSL